MPKFSISQDRLTALRRSVWFDSLSDELQSWLAENSRPLAIVASQRLFGRGDAPQGLYFVVDGAIRITTSSADGREVLLALAEAPQWFGEAGLFDGSRRTHDAWAESDALLLHIAQRVLLAFLEQHPAHWRAMGVLLAHKLKLAFIGIESVALLPTAPRLAHRLVAIATGYGDWNGRNKQVIEVQQDQLGSMLALSRQTVNQILKDFEVQGWVRRTRGSIEIVDFEGLKRFAQPGIRA